MRVEFRVEGSVQGLQHSLRFRVSGFRVEG